jgi:hypothetical protein
LGFFYSFISASPLPPLTCPTPMGILAAAVFTDHELDQAATYVRIIRYDCSFYTNITNNKEMP